MKKLIGVALLSGVLGMTLLSSCRGAGPSYTFVGTSEQGDVDVQFMRQENNDFWFMVYNHSDKPVVVYRDRVELLKDGRNIKRIPGGMSNRYEIEVDDSHDLKVSYDLKALGNPRTVIISLEKAIKDDDGKAIQGPRFELELKAE